MTETPPLPGEARAWLREVDQRIRSLPEEQRVETLTGLADHLGELTASGVSGPEAVARLGSARDVAEAAFQQYQQQTGVDARERYLTTKRVVQIVALALAVAAALVIALFPIYTEATETSEGTESFGGATLLEVNGLWSLVLLAIPVMAAGLPLFARGRAWQPLSIASAVLLTGCVIVGFVSLGWYFLPAAVAAIVGACLSSQPHAVSRAHKPA